MKMAVESYSIFRFAVSTILKSTFHDINTTAIYTPPVSEGFWLDDFNAIYIFGEGRVVNISILQPHAFHAPWQAPQRPNSMTAHSTQLLYILAYTVNAVINALGVY